MSCKKAKPKTFEPSRHCLFLNFQNHEKVLVFIPFLDGDCSWA